jgi:transcriptional regulator with XRE-family HTH domain
MILLRRLMGDVLRRHRLRQSRTLRDVAAAARVSLGYLSEVERGRKEPSSELLSAICEALGISLADVLREVSDDLAMAESRQLAPIGFVTTRPDAVARPVAGLAPLVPGAPTVRRERPVAPVASLSVVPVVAA